MIGANLIFHVASALVVIGLIALVLRLKAQRDTLRSLLAGSGRRFVLMEPGAFVGKLAAACGISFESEGKPGDVRKIAIDPWREMFSREQVSLIRWSAQRPNQDGLVVIQVTDAVQDLERLEKDLKASLGERVLVKIERTQ